jgi:hypothetical protein
VRAAVVGEQGQRTNKRSEDEKMESGNLTAAGAGRRKGEKEGEPKLESA